MNILFLTMAKIGSLEESGVYTDLLKKFSNEGHKVYLVCPLERREGNRSVLKKSKNGALLSVWTLNLQKSNLLEKGTGTLLLEKQYLAGIKKFFPNKRFDLVLYSTPPVTFSTVIQYIKKRDGALSYLLLKDIFPQNAVDMKMMRKGGIIHKFFLRKEKKLYTISDVIGCMSEKNKEYLIKNYPWINPEKIEVNPNTINPVSNEANLFEIMELKKKYALPLNKKIFVYGGNLGKPQGLDFLLDTIENTQRDDVFFLIVGSGTEFRRINLWFNKNNPQNALLLKSIPKMEYENLLKSCDVGMLFLHKDFTIPNFPSRLLSYLEKKLPVLAATDPNTDVGQVIENGKCGKWVETGDQESMQQAVSFFCDNREVFAQMRENAWTLLNNSYHVDISFNLIKQRLKHV